MKHTASKLRASRQGRGDVLLRSGEKVAAGRMRCSPVSPSALTAFRVQVASWAGRIRVQPRQIRVQSMRRKWASCSTSGTVSFNLELLAQPSGFQEYVIVHELLHLKVPNHGKLFKTLLRAYLPNHESLKVHSLTPD